MNKLLAAMLLAAPLLANAAQADFYGPCDVGAVSNADSGTCIAKKMQKERKELATLYQSYLKDAAGPQESAKIAASQKAWLQYKKAELALSYEENQGGQMAGTFAAELESRLINHRMDELKDTIKVN